MKEHIGCSVGGSFGDNETPLPLSFFYLFNEAGARSPPHLLDLSTFVQPELKTLSGGEFGWGGTSVKR